MTVIISFMHRPHSGAYPPARSAPFRSSIFARREEREYERDYNERDYDRRDRRDYERTDYKGYRPGISMYERRYESQPVKRPEKNEDRFDTEKEEILFIIAQERECCPPIGMLVAPLAKATKFRD